jgi:hypothetical protein
MDLEFQSAAVPDVHIFTKTKAPWITLPTDKPAFEEFYSYDEYWSRESLARREAAKPLAKKWKEKKERFWYGQTEVVGEEKMTEMMASLKLSDGEGQK